ncbi:MAG: FGGY family carbohydrate kinase [Gammaproteobacteria bacterium]
MTDKTILVIDVGTQSTRASLIDATGRTVALSKVSAAAPQESSPGHAEVDVDHVFERMRSACLALRELDDQRYATVSGVTLTTQRATTVFLDAQDRPLRPAMLWSDQRRVESPKPVGGPMGLAIALSGATQTVNALRGRSPLLWLAKHEPRLFAASRRVVFLSSYLLFRLSDRWVDSAASQVGYLPFNFRQRNWYTPRNWRWRALGLRSDHQLVSLVAPGTPIGVVGNAAAQALGLKSETPILAAAADKACEVLGSGGLEPGTTCVSFGTAATVNLIHDRFATVERFRPAFGSADGRGFLSEVQIALGFSRVTWFLREFGADLLEQPESRPAEAQLDAYLTKSRAQRGALVVDPFFASVVLPLTPAMRAETEIRIKQHGRALVYRALMESLMLDLKQALIRLERRRATRASEVIIAGGGARSDPLMQLAANVFGRPALRAAAPEASSLGAAICAAVALGWHPDFTTAVSHMIGPATRFLPEPEARSAYQQRHRERS